MQYSAVRISGVVVVWCAALALLVSSWGHFSLQVIRTAALQPSPFVEIASSLVALGVSRA